MAVTSQPSPPVRLLSAKALLRATYADLAETSQQIAEELERRDFERRQQDGARIRERRIRLGLRQVQVSATTGLSQGYISMIEKGQRSPSPDMLKLLAKALDCDADDLFTPAGGDQ